MLYVCDSILFTLITYSHYIFYAENKWQGELKEMSSGSEMYEDQML